ncbi:probable Endo-1,4-beta-xylanase 22 [Cephalotrichum gorgonifer]|uniref:Endo-1,4-beta-xylanase n=1 Tax=Cephalotrichum gorgonifer TaxID=2041049 RepID=A0AAE8N2D2_9PEZI|nr:probable Endo-1,4-beta-xylanase 22 [Cephalotrichum gorgonifer]
MLSYTSILTALVAVTGVIATPAASPMDLMRRQNTPNGEGTHNGYYYSWWSDGASPATYTNLEGGSYSVNWQSGGNLVGGKGWNPGGPKEITYSGTWSPVNNGNSYLTIYGWTRNPLVEYYIVENHGEYNPGSQATPKGSIQYDGATYNLYQSTRTQQPSIDGTQTFQQYWAIRQQGRTAGTVDTGVFFDAWAAQGMRLGNHYYMIVATEAYRSAGSSHITVETPP